MHVPRRHNLHGRIVGRLGATILLALLPWTGAHATTIELANAWMRPVPVGQDSARVYVDVTSDTPVTVISATTPVAQSVDLVRAPIGGSVDEERVVTTVPVTPGAPTRFAFRGDHIRLVKLARPLGGGETFPLTLSFADADGRVYRATTVVTVRGFMAPPRPAADPPPR